MAVDTFVAYVGTYDNAADADADYEAVKDLHAKAGVIDAYDAAVIERRAGGKVKITKKHETPTRIGGVLGGGAGLATGLVVALFPFAAVGGGLLAAATGGGRGGLRSGRNKGRWFSPSIAAAWAASSCVAARGAVGAGRARCEWRSSQALRHHPVAPVPVPHRMPDDDCCST